MADTKEISRKLSYALYPSIALVLTGSVLRVMHWPYANMIVLAGSILLVLLTILRFAFVAENKIEASFKALFVLSIATLFINSLYGNIQNRWYILIAAGTSLFLWQGFRFVLLLKEARNKVSKLVIVAEFFSGLARGIILFGIIGKLLHLSYSNTLVFIGFLMLLPWVLLQLLGREDKTEEE